MEKNKNEWPSYWEGDKLVFINPAKIINLGIDGDKLTIFTETKVFEINYPDEDTMITILSMIMK